MSTQPTIQPLQITAGISESQREILSPGALQFIRSYPLLRTARGNF